MARPAMPLTAQSHINVYELVMKPAFVVDAKMNFDNAPSP